MLRLTEPSEQVLGKLRLSQERAAVSFPLVGATRVPRAPAGYRGDHHRLRIGWGEGAFQRAGRALRAWSMYATEWTRVYPAAAPLEAGVTVLLLARHYGLWSVHGARIVEVIEDETEKQRRFGFALATLAGHALDGEKRFLIEHQKDDNAVWYDLLAYSRPAGTLARFSHPLVRILQKQFANDSKRAMGRAMADAEAGES